MNRLLSLTSTNSVRLLSSQSTLTQLRPFSFNVGDKIPINFIKDEPAPVIQEDSAYPEWIFDLNKRNLTMNELIKKYQQVGVTGLSLFEKKRVKRLIGLHQIKNNNADTKKSG